MFDNRNHPIHDESETLSEDFGDACANVTNVTYNIKRKSNSADSMVCDSPSDRQNVTEILRTKLKP